MHNDTHDVRINGATDLEARFDLDTEPGTQLAQKLPRGITVGRWHDGRAKAFFVRHGRPRKYSSFMSEDARNAFANGLCTDIEKSARQMQEFSLAGWQDFQAFRVRTGFAPLSNIELVWNERRGTLHLDKTVGQAIDQFLTFRDGEGLAADSVRHTRTILTRFASHFGSRNLTDLTADHIREWLAALEKRHHFESVTLRHHRKDVNTFFGRAVKEGWALKNPCEAVTPPKIDRDGDVTCWSLREAFDFFKANRKSPIVGKLALEAFAGLRCSSAAKLVRGEIVFEEKGLALAPGKHKSGRRYYVDGFPDNLWAWLGEAKDGPWVTNLSTYNLRKQHAFLASGRKNPGNVMRHSFCTFHVAAFKDVAKTAVLLTHRSPSTLYQHYKGRGVSEVQGKAYFAITPKAVAGSWKTFCRLNSLPSK